MIISPFTPLFFEKLKSDGIESRYVQTFATTDRILVQIINFADEEEGDWVLYSEPDHVEIGNIDYQFWNVGDNIAIDFAVLSLPPGLYSLRLNDMTSQPFRVTDDPQVLDKTTLIQYSMKDNKQRQDAMFIINGMRYFFDFRVPGGFKDSGWTFAVENEQFITPEADPVELFALESTQKKFTMGHQEGVPVYFAELLNRLLTCTYVYFDGVRYARKNSSAPEMTVQMEGLDSFVFTQMLQKVSNLNPIIENSNHLIMRRVSDGEYRATSNSDNTITKRIIQ